MHATYDALIFACLYNSFVTSHVVDIMPVVMVPSPWTMF